MNTIKEINISQETVTIGASVFFCCSLSEKEVKLIQLSKEKEDLQTELVEAQKRRLFIHEIMP